MRQEEKQVATKLIRPNPSKEEKMEQSKKVARVRARRDEGIDSILISDISEYLEAYKDDEKIQAEIKRYHDTSKARETFKRLEKESLQRKMYNGRHDWGKDPVDDRETFQDDWWKTDALIKVANEGIAAEEKLDRSRKRKEFISKISGLTLLNNFRRKRKAKKKLESVAIDFLNGVFAGDYSFNNEESLSINLYNFIKFALQTKYMGCRGILTPSQLNDLVYEFKTQENLKDHDKATKKILLDFYKYFRENHK